MRLRNRNAQLRHTAEGTPKAGFWSKFSTFLYGLALISILGLALMYGADRWLNFEVRGQVRAQTQPVSAERGGRILSLFTQRGQPVQIGDSLARIRPKEVCGPPDSTRLQDIQGELELTRIELQNIRETIRYLQLQLQQLRQERALEVGLVEEKIHGLKQNLRESRQRERMLGARLDVQQQRLQQARESLQQDPRCQPFIVQAPAVGTVATVYHRSGDVISSGEPILDVQIENGTPVRVWAYMDEDLFGSLHQGKILEVELPGGQNTRGVVETVYSSAHNFAQPKWRDYEPMETQLMVEIRPADDSIARLWRQFNHMDVDVRGDK